MREAAVVKRWRDFRERIVVYRNANIGVGVRHRQ
jgi:hypothetical protein